MGVTDSFQPALAGISTSVCISRHHKFYRWWGMAQNFGGRGMGRVLSRVMPIAWYTCLFIPLHSTGGIAGSRRLAVYGYWLAAYMSWFD